MASSQDLNISNGQDFSASLLVLANYSNFYSVITVLVCFIITVVFILRLNGDHIAFSSTVVVKHVIPEQRMIGIQNPFSLQMDSTKSSALLSGLHCLVSSLGPSTLFSYWGVNIQSLYREFQLPWRQLQDRILSDTFLTGSYIAKDKPLSLESCSQKAFHLTTPSAMTDVSMTANSRTMYPIVVLNISLNATCPPDVDGVQVVAMLSSIHLKDSLCNINSYIINQHMKTYNNQIFNLQPIFIASLPDDDISQNPTPQNPQPTTTTNTTTTPTTGNTESPTDSNSSSPKVTPAPAHLTSTDSCATTTTTTTTENTAGTSSVQQQQLCSGGGTTNEDHQPHPPSPTPAPSSSTTSSNAGESGGSVPTLTECIVCQCETISMALLPCRHACVCRTCFTKLDRCPLCREYIQSYFFLQQQQQEQQQNPCCSSNSETAIRRGNTAGSNSDPYTQAGLIHHHHHHPTQPSSSPPPPPHIPLPRRRTLKQWLMHVNDVVNEYLGFT
ncbi:cell growth regulator with RING finger domain protein 1-like [Argonauta hians]